MISCSISILVIGVFSLFSFVSLARGCQFDRSFQRTGVLFRWFSLLFLFAVPQTHVLTLRDSWGKCLWGEGTRSDLSKVSVYRIVPVPLHPGWEPQPRGSRAVADLANNTLICRLQPTCSQIKPCMPPLQSHVSISVTPRPSLIHQNCFNCSFYQIWFY